MREPPQAIKTVVEAWPLDAQAHLAEARQVILATAAAMPEVGPITETLKRGEPAWLTEASKSGTTIRAAWAPKRPEVFGIHLNCRTTLVARMRHLYPDAFTYDGTRALLKPLTDPLPTDPLDHVVRMALRYHLTG